MEPFAPHDKGFSHARETLHDWLANPGQFRNVSSHDGSPEPETIERALLLLRVLERSSMKDCKCVSVTWGSEIDLSFVTPHGAVCYLIHNQSHAIERFVLDREMKVTYRDVVCFGCAEPPFAVVETMTTNNTESTA